ncbi:MAG TPA: acyl-CoA dehydrogenase family protein [Polyangiaceae bacterium]
MIPFLEEAHVKLGDELRGRVRAMDWSSDEPADHVAKLGLLHVLPLLAPEKSVRALCVAREILAHASPMADAIFAVLGLASHPLILAGADRWRARIDDVLAGRTVGGFALTEPEAGSDVASLRSTAKRVGDGWRLDGEKTFISNVGIARYYVVFANADPSLGKKGISAFLVESDAPGLALEPIATIDDHPLGRLHMKGAHAELVGEVGHGLRLALGTLDVFRTSVGAAANGMAQRALDEALAHVKTRVQFGKPLAEFQLVQAALADMATELHAARLMVLHAAWAKDTARAGKTEVAMAKMFATEAAQRIVDRAVQLLGGLGVVRGGAVERMYRSVRALRIYEGTTEIQKLIVGGALVAGGAS